MNDLFAVAAARDRNRPSRPARSIVQGLWLLALAALVSACSGGGGDGNEGFACTTEVRSSVVLTVVDQFGAALPGAVVTYQVNGGAAQTQSCAANGVCAIGFELSGLFSLTAAKAGYTAPAATVTVNRDQCHVITERLTLMLRPAS